MNIKKHNCQEYFLLYADKELSVPEMKQVELFVKFNPEYEEEFLMLQQSVIKPDMKVALWNKDFLLKKEPEFINSSNQDEIFILYHDDELIQEDRKSLEDYTKNTSQQKELAFFGSLKIQTDPSIIFENKAVLYHRPVKRIRLAWIMAAAIFISLLTWSELKYISRVRPIANTALVIDSKFNVIANRRTKRITTINTSPQINNLSLHPVGEGSNARPSVSSRYSIALNGPKNIIIKKKVISHEVDINLQTLANSKNINADQLASNDLPKPLLSSRIISENNISKRINPEKTSLTSPVNFIALPASYTVDENQKNENYVFYHVTEDQFRRSKVGAFLKKMRRIISRKNPLNNFKNNQSDPTN